MRATVYMGGGGVVAMCTTPLWPQKSLEKAKNLTFFSRYLMEYFYKPWWSMFTRKTGTGSLG